jgi:organic hydroperoxide reductase OsmC/OhrA
LSTYRAEVTWHGGRDDLRAHTVRMAAQDLACSSNDGAQDKADPEEMLVGAISACHMLWFLNRSRHERLRVTSYSDSPEGEMEEERFTRVVLRPQVEFESDPGQDTVRRLHQAAHERCYIANSVNFPVVVE